MKIKHIAVMVSAIALMAVAGCAAFADTRNPNIVERTIYDVHTNYIDVAVLHTNVVTQVNTVTVTNEQNNIVTTTNTVVMTNIVSSTDQVPVYGLTTKTATASTVSAIGAGINIVAPGVGSCVSLGLMALLTLFAHLRGLKHAATSSTLAQEVETMREFIQSLPNGTKYDTAITGWLQAHQLETGVATQVLGIVGNVVDNPAAKVAAQEISATLTQLGTPVPKQS